jgi:hypothetical protein
MGVDITQIPIVLHTMDSYSSYWDNWYKLFKKYVHNHGPIYFLTEEKEPSFVDEIIHIKTGAGEWGARLLNGLSQIDSDLIFYMQEDFWAIKDINFSDDLINLFSNYNMNCLRICLKSNLPNIHLDLVDTDLYKYRQTSNYTISHQFSLWDKGFFSKYIYPFQSPWDNEIYGTQNVNQIEHKIYYMENHWYEPVCRHGILQPVGYEILKKHNLNFFGK